MKPCKYPQIFEGEKIIIKWEKEDHKISCCDCGLVHRFRFNVKGSKLVTRAWRDNRATGQIRRWKKK